MSLNKEHETYIESTVSIVMGQVMEIASSRIINDQLWDELTDAVRRAFYMPEDLLPLVVNNDKFEIRISANGGMTLEVELNYVPLKCRHIYPSVLALQGCKSRKLALKDAQKQMTGWLEDEDVEPASAVSEVDRFVAECIEKTGYTSDWANCRDLYQSYQIWSAFEKVGAVDRAEFDELLIAKLGTGKMMAGPSEQIGEDSDIWIGIKLKGDDDESH